jgi:hypothetical protein
MVSQFSSRVSPVRGPPTKGRSALWDEQRIEYPGAVVTVGQRRAASDAGEQPVTSPMTLACVGGAGA